VAQLFSLGHLAHFMQNKLQDLADITLRNNALLISLTEHIIRLYEISGSKIPESDLAELRSVLSKSKADLPKTRREFGLSPD